MGSRRPKLSIEQIEAIEMQDCATCGKPASEAKGGRHGCVTDADGNARSECVPCWNASVEEYQRQRKAELAARPKCEACGRKPQTWTLAGSDGPVSICGTCRNRVSKRIRTPMLFGPPSASRAAILAAALAS
jgi:hypothetical protein